MKGTFNENYTVMRALSLISVALVMLVTANCEKNTDPVPIPVNQNPVVNTGNPNLDSIMNNTPYEVPTAAEEEALKLMREEEKMARDLYLNAFDDWNVQIFQNISGSEQRHMDAVKALLTKYSLTDPVLNDGRGLFVNPVIDSIYTLLDQQAGLSKIDALKMGAFVEEFDIKDLRELKDHVVDNTDITLVFDELERGSRNHLRSFYENLQNQGITYVPQVLSQAEFDAIINSPHETGGGM